MEDDYYNSEEAIKARGEVFTPTVLVNEMLDALPVSVFEDNELVLEPSIGDGQFAYQILKRKMSHGYSHLEALKTIYGCELTPSNVTACRKRLLNGEKPTPELIEILKRNIICADALDPEHKGWEKVGFYWSKLVPYKDKLNKLLTELANAKCEKDVATPWKEFVRNNYTSGSFSYPNKCNGLFTATNSMLFEFYYDVKLSDRKQLCQAIAKLLHYAKKFDKLPNWLCVCDTNECVRVGIKRFNELLEGDYDWDKFTPANSKKNKKLLEALDGMLDVKVWEVNDKFDWRKMS